MKISVFKCDLWNKITKSLFKIATEKFDLQKMKLAIFISTKFCPFIFAKSHSNARNDMPILKGHILKHTHTFQMQCDMQRSKFWLFQVTWHFAGYADTSHGSHDSWIFPSLTESSTQINLCAYFHIFILFEWKQMNLNVFQTYKQHPAHSAH